MGPLGHIGETPGEALQVVRFTGHSDWPFRAVMLMFSNYRAGTCQVTRCGAFSVIHSDFMLLNGLSYRTHTGYYHSSWIGKDLSLYLNYFPLEMVFTS